MRHFAAIRRFDSTFTFAFTPTIMSLRSLALVPLFLLFAATAIVGLLPAVIAADTSTKTANLRSSITAGGAGSSGPSVSTTTQTKVLRISANGPIQQDTGTTRNLSDCEQGCEIMCTGQAIPFDTCYNNCIQDKCVFPSCDGISDDKERHLCIDYFYKYNCDDEYQSECPNVADDIYDEFDHLSMFAGWPDWTKPISILVPSSTCTEITDADRRKTCSVFYFSGCAFKRNQLQPDCVDGVEDVIKILQKNQGAIASTGNGFALIISGHPCYALVENKQQEDMCLEWQEHDCATDDTTDKCQKVWKEVKREHGNNVVPLWMDAFFSEAPSAAPSSEPSMVPTSVPSLTPSYAPSISPSAEPSDIPSQYPSSEPSAVPSTLPTSAPSRTPSYAPSTSPTSEPSDIPSQYPSTSASPSAEPSNVPSQSPSTSPSAEPSDIPSQSPSTSASPSAGPTISSAPSAAPTMACRADDGMLMLRATRGGNTDWWQGIVEYTERSCNDICNVVATVCGVTMNVPVDTECNEAKQEKAAEDEASIRAMLHNFDGSHGDTYCSSVTIGYCPYGICPTQNTSNKRCFHRYEGSPDYEGISRCEKKVRRGDSKFCCCGSNCPMHYQ